MSKQMSKELTNDAKQLVQGLPKVSREARIAIRDDDLGEAMVFEDVIKEELNVKQVEFTSEADHYVSYKVVPNFKAIGAKYRALVPGIKEALAKIADAAAARKQLAAEGALPLVVQGPSGAETVNLR